MPDPYWFEDIHSKNPKPFRRRGPTNPGECEGASVYKDGSVQAMVDEYIAAGWELVSKTPCELGTALQFRGPEKKAAS